MFPEALCEKDDMSVKALVELCAQAVRNGLLSPLRGGHQDHLAHSWERSGIHRGGRPQYVGIVIVSTCLVASRLVIEVMGHPMYVRRPLAVKI